MFEFSDGVGGAISMGTSMVANRISFEYSKSPLPIFTCTYTSEHHLSIRLQHVQLTPGLLCVGSLLWTVVRKQDRTTKTNFVLGTVVVLT